MKTILPPHGTAPPRAFQKGLTLPALALLAALGANLGCHRDQISRFRVPKEGPPPAQAGLPSDHPPMGAPAGMPPSAPPGMTGDVPPPPSPSKGLKWNLPKGWTMVQGSGMRFATLNPPAGTGKAEVSVVVLPGPAGGELANVNRWRGQIGLPPIDDAALAAARKTVKAKVGPVNVYDFTSEGMARSRMVAGLLTTPDGNTWFLKLTGDADPVGKAKPEFTRLLETLHLD